MRLFGYDITIRKYRPFKPYVAPPLDTLTMREVEKLAERIGEPGPLPAGTSARAQLIRRGGLSVQVPSEGDALSMPGPMCVTAITRPVRLLDTLEWAWALDNPVEEPAHAAKD